MLKVLFASSLVFLTSTTIFLFLKKKKKFFNKSGKKNENDSNNSYYTTRLNYLKYLTDQDRKIDDDDCLEKNNIIYDLIKKRFDLHSQHIKISGTFTKTSFIYYRR